MAERLQEELRPRSTSTSASSTRRRTSGSFLTRSTTSAPRICCAMPTRRCTGQGEGKARYEVFTPEMRARVVRLLRLETDLRRVVTGVRGLHQPIVPLRRCEVVDFEALARW